MAHLEGLGYETLHVSEGYSNHIHTETRMGRLDFIYVRGATSTKLFDGCRERVVLGDRRVPVPRPEHLAAMKVQAMKNDPRRVPQDLADVAFLLRLPATDREEIRGYFAKAGLTTRFEELLASL